MVVSRKIKARLFALLLALSLALCAVPSASAAEGFRYAHDPRLNPHTMADVIVDPAAVYGFSPSPEGSLASYAAFDWSDPAIVNGESGREARIAYHESIGEMYVMLREMFAEGKSTEEIARAVSTRRNELRLAAYTDDPEAIAAAKAHNLERYGDENGGSPDYFFARYGSWETVIEKAFSTNSGMDACLGLYDDYYDLYITCGQIEPEDETAATREYAAAVFAAAAGLAPAEDAPGVPFADAAAVSACFASEVTAAVNGGLLRGYEDGTLRPQNAVRRVEALVLLSRCLPAQETAAELPAGVPAWAAAEVAKLIGAGWTDIGALEETMSVTQVKALAAFLNGASGE